MINFTSKPRYDLSDLIRLVHVLRAPGGCPWDAAQTHLSIRRNFLEEAYEACEALDCDDAAMLREELGDVLLQVLFHADIETGRGRMTIDDIADAECKKLIFRHPFLFGGEAESWDELKQKEKGQKTTGEAMAGVARSLPATWRAEKIQKKAAKTGFRWESADEALDKLAEETGELREAVRDHTNIDEELGDVLFAAPPRWNGTRSRRCTRPAKNSSVALPLWSRRLLPKAGPWKRFRKTSCLPDGTRRNVSCPAVNNNSYTL